MTLMFVCGPDKGTKAKPYRCICCHRTYADREQLGVSICWSCMGDDWSCASCRERGVWVSDFRVGRWLPALTKYDPEGGLGHRLAAVRRVNGVMACGVRIPKEHFGGGSAVVPPCPECWPEALP